MARPVDLAKGSRFLILASVCVVVAALYFAQEVLIPLALAILFCFLLAPLVTRLERLRLGRVPAVIVVVLAALALVGGLAYVVTAQVLRLLDDLPSYRNNIVTKVQSFRGGGGAFEKASTTIGELAEELSKPKPDTRPAGDPTTVPAASEVGSWREVLEAFRQQAVPPEPPAGSTPKRPIYTRESPDQSPFATTMGYLGRVAGPLATFGLVIVFVIFMLLQREDLRDRIIRLSGKGHVLVTTAALDDAGTRISRYLLAQSIVNGSYGVAIAGGLWLIGRIWGRDAAGAYVPFPSVVVWGLLCAVLRFIPYIGPWLAAAFPVALAFAVYPHAGVFVATLALFVVIELASNNIMEPWLYGTSTGMSTVAILAAAVFWTWLWGPVGLLLATPLTVILVVLGKYVPQLQFLDILLGDEPVLEPHARVYQRLLATDQEEASELVMQLAAERPLEEVYGAILVPALSMAEQDRHRGRVDAERQAFIHQAMRDIVDEVWDRQQAAGRQDEAARIRQAAAETVLAAKTGTREANGNGNGNRGAATAPPAPAAPAAAGRATVPQGCEVNVLLLPAHDDADDIAAVMLSQLLQLRGYCAYPVSVTKLASEMVEAVSQKRADIVVVSAMPPAAVAHSRYLCKRLHARFPDVNMLVGLWTSRADVAKAKQRITCEQSVTVVTTFDQALEQVHQAAQPIILRAREAAATGGAARTQP